MKFLRKLFKTEPAPSSSAAPQRTPLEQAVALHQEGRLGDAKAIYEQILTAQPNHSDAMHLLGVVATQSGDHRKAVGLIDGALALNPENAAAHFNRGNALKALKEFDAAIESYDKAIALHSGYAEAYSNRGLALQELRRLDAALASYDRAVTLNPEFASAWYNRGNALQEAGDPAGAVESYDRALALAPQLGKCWHNRGFALKRLQQWEAAIKSFERALELNPDFDFLPGMLLVTKLDICDWDGFDEQLEGLTAALQHREKVTPPFALLAVTDSPALQRVAAETYVQARYPANNALGAIPARPRRDRIRIGYYSADFRNHPISYLMAELFETHDRSRFEVIGFSFGADSNDEMRARVASAFDDFIDVRALSDREIAAMSRELGIDIAVDLGGHTQDARTGVFALRAAPVQASYAGYLGTMGADYYDYLFADPCIIQESSRQYYCEKIAVLPTYQANSSTRHLGDRSFTREELSLPTDGFVLCCFNNSYKIMPSTFARWMRILERVEGSVLVLYARNETTMLNLSNEALALGIDPTRIIFAENLPRPEYLSRFRTMDLFLDTFPYNAGTVASDALWAGLPVLTMAGESFASRMAASLLAAVGLPDLITRTPEEYEARAIELAMDPGRLLEIKARLAERHATPLFDMDEFRRPIEAAYAAMYDRYRAGLPPDHLTIPR